MSDVGMSPATMLATLLLAQQSAAEAEHGVRGDLLEELLTARPEETEHLHIRAKRLGRDLTSPHVLVAVHVVEARAKRTSSWATAYAHRNRGLTTQRHGWLIFMLPGESPQAAADGVVTELSRAIGHPVTAGAAGPVTSLHTVGDTCQEAISCARVLLALGKSGEAAEVEQLGFVGLLVREKPELEPFIEATIGPLLSYDARRGTALRATLQTYLDSGQKLSWTATNLHIHINTAAQRLSRITVVLGPSWQEPQRMLDIHVALRLHQVRQAIA
ncbi:helix-turn-helix domain-containing protein [Streptomyces sp. AK02-04a]|uniref:PucR family transcriptional regulator n=1 Tax=Streptomyces sp. AK02-04a TaxID=3028649 RepID=UPI0029B1BB54|nr:helix-turn-helix domain-containing protein [Streptomyces sp. AK02-04a]MDX3763041.1 helix-turn-helix domain-containing protein [Streptomyces sp. AK02-04a]